MGRDALLMSISPRPNFLNPPPVPETPTVTRTSGPTARNSSATASVIGYTVLEPSIVISPVKPPDERLPPQAHSATAPTVKKRSWICLMIGCVFCCKGIHLQLGLC